MMKKSMKRILAICIVASLSAVTFGCSSGGNNAPRETISLEDTKQELQFFYNAGNSVDSTEAAAENENNSSADSTAENPAATEGEPATEIVTEYVEVTDAQGEQVTEADGTVQTEVHTEVATVPSSTETQTAATEAPAEHVPSYDTCKAYWLDMSQAGDFTFNGEFLVVEFQINENVPDGSYPISVVNPDFGNWDAISCNPAIINGEITVGNAKAAEKETAGNDGFTMTVENASGKPGDTVKVVINLENNPGFCGFLCDIQYDAAALTIVDAYEGSDFGAAINYLP